ncbi:MAG: RNase J family beta-CASP ribonuclease [Nanoarchaeota archaeon]|nr:RNase J family beta-CASP ribonuclease [Nanoarchaeota archaeon]MBU1632137.1 RNase J family beta-CASP ribonuclease [Nanoarchaeota archaeon]MBU1876338.1 RNase J family beta-CASP ribonuclease [Nanoarchaeota archaeon]
MSIEICTIGGFSETGKNSTAVKIDEEVVILDMGLHMENYIRYTEDEDIRAMTYEELLQVNAVPNYDLINDWKDKVIGIIPSHGHLDHIGAIPFSASIFPKSPIICTPYTAEVLRSIFKDERISIPNNLISLNLNSIYKLSENISVELVNMTHSIPHASMIVLHTPYGKIVYANDYKFDRQPTLGKTPNFDRLQEIGKEGALLLIVECLYAHEHKKMPSESVAKQMLKDVMLGVHAEKKAMIVTTFSSHLARLKSIIELGNKLNRKIVFLGRSLSKYVTAGERINLIDFQKNITLVKHRDRIEKILTKINKEGKQKYLLVVTGHQGEPKAILSRMVRNELPFKFENGDVVIFSCSVIPVELNKDNRDKLERQIRSKGARIFKDIHVSGHAAREDHRDLIELVKPKHIIPSHAGQDKANNLASLAEEMGYKRNKSVHLMEDGKRIILK